jgi:hypothetical protein
VAQPPRGQGARRVRARDLQRRQQRRDRRGARSAGRSAFRAARRHPRRQPRRGRGGGGRPSRAPPDNIDALEGARASTGGRAFVGARREKRDSLFARAGWRASTAACNAIYGTRYSDFSSSCQLVEGPLLRGLCLEARGLNYSLDVIARLLEQGVRPIEVPIRHLPRASGRSSRTLVRSSVDRASFVLYLGLRRALLDRRVLC